MARKIFLLKTLLRVKFDYIIMIIARIYEMC